MFRLKLHAATFAVIIGLLMTFNQTARAESWSWESILSVFSSENAVAVCTTNPVVVNNLNSGVGSLRQAVIDSCPDSTITFNVTGTIPLSTGRIVIDKNLTIQGPGANLLTVRNSSTSYDRVFQVNSGVTATLAGLTVTGGTFSIYIDNQNGAGINNQGNLTVTDATITGNTLGTISSASSKGGGIYNAGTGTLTVTNSTISNNSAVGSGGGIFNDSGTVTITKSSITGNQVRFNSGGGGGGISNYGGVVTVTDSTVSNNRSGQTGPSGGGLKNDNGGTITLTNSTVSSNRAESFGTGGGGGGIILQRAEQVTGTDSTVSHDLSTEDKPGGGRQGLPDQN